jgi:hypothetical protein
LKNYRFKTWKKSRSEQDKAIFVAACKNFEPLLHDERFEHGRRKFGPHLSTQTLYKNLKTTGIIKSSVVINPNLTPEMFNHHFSDN